jgi:hypothetical protein
MAKKKKFVFTRARRAALAKARRVKARKSHKRKGR